MLLVVRILGFNEWKVFFKIVVLLVWFGIIGGLVLLFVRVFGEFGVIFMIVGNIFGKI